MSSEHAAAQYRQPSRQGGAPRETEGRALLEAARRLAVARDNPDDTRTMLETVRLNWRLWTIFQSEVSAPASPLPAELKNNVLTLCNFIDKRTVELLSAPDAQKLEVLISINRNIAAGLLNDAGGERTAVETPDAPALGRMTA